VAQQIEGTVVSFDTDGNLVTDISVDRLEGVPRDERVSVTCDEHETAGIFGPGHDQPEMTLLAILGQHGALQISIVGDSAKIMLGIDVGERVVVRWT